jgi:hypothetical protein
VCRQSEDVSGYHYRLRGQTPKRSGERRLELNQKSVLIENVTGKRQEGR